MMYSQHGCPPACLCRCLSHERAVCSSGAIFDQPLSPAPQSIPCLERIDGFDVPKVLFVRGDNNASVGFPDCGDDGVERTLRTTANSAVGHKFGPDEPSLFIE